MMNHIMTIIFLLAQLFLVALGNATPPDHPVVVDYLGDAGILGYTFQETFEHIVDGEIESKGTGFIATSNAQWWHPYYLEAMVSMEVDLYIEADNGAVKRNSTWIAWNNVVLDKVDRYLIVSEFDASGTSLGDTMCYHYEERNPDGYIDPILLMDERYNLVSYTDMNATYQYDWVLQSDALQTSVMITPVAGGPPERVDISVTADDKSGVNSSYRFLYTDGVYEVDFSLFDQYSNYDCVEVANFTAPDVCIDSWLALEYECS